MANGKTFPLGLLLRVLKVGLFTGFGISLVVCLALMFFQQVPNLGCEVRVSRQSYLPFEAAYADFLAEELPKFYQEWPSLGRFTSYRLG